MLLADGSYPKEVMVFPLEMELDYVQRAHPIPHSPLTVTIPIGHSSLARCMIELGAKHEPKLGRIREPTIQPLSLAVIKRDIRQSKC
jgi:hypothetical protein